MSQVPKETLAPPATPGTWRAPTPGEPESAPRRTSRRRSAEPPSPQLIWASEVATALDEVDMAALGRLAETIPTALGDRALLTQIAEDGVRGLQQRTWATAVPLLRYLAGLFATEPPDRVARHLTAVAALLVRIELGRDDSKRAVEEARLALERVGDTGGCLAALAMYHREQGAIGLASDKAHQAVERDPERFDGYVALGLCLEDEDSDPTDQYRKAIDLVWHRDDPHGALTGLLGPFTPRLMHLLAERAVGEHRPTVAFAALRTLLDGDIEAPNRYQPAADEMASAAAALELRARARAMAEESSAEIVSDLVAAADRLAWSGDLERARSLLEEAVERDPAHAEARYTLADILRVSADQLEPKLGADLLDASLWHWETAHAEASEPPQAWVLRARAAIAASRAEQIASRPYEERWDAMGYVEHALLIDESDPLSYALLAGLLRQVGLWSAGLAALDAAATLPGSSGKGIEQERVLLLGAAGYFAEALEALDGLPDWSLTDRVRAYVLAFSDDPAGIPAAVTVLEPFATQSGADSWVRSALAHCYRRLGRVDEARAQMEALWADRGMLLNDNKLEAVAAGIRTGRHDEAMALLRSVNPDPLHGAYVARFTGLCRLARGDAGGAEDLISGVRMDTRPWELGDLRYDLDDLIQRAGDEAPDEVLATITQVRDELDARVRGPWPRLSAREELAAIAGRGGAGPAVVARAGLARACREEGDLDGAAELYAELRETDWARLAEPGLRAVSRALRRRAEAAAEEGHAEDAARWYSAAADMLAGTGTRPDVERAALHARIALAAPALDSPAAMAAQLRAAIATLGQGNADASGQELADVVRPLLDPAGYWSFTDACARIRAEVGSSSWDGLVSTAAERALSSTVADLLSEGGDQPVARRPTLMVEFGTALQEPDDPTWELLRRNLLGLSERMKAQLALALPEVTLQASGMLPPLDYAVSFNGLLAKRGRVQPAASPQEAEAAAFDALEPVLGDIEVVARRHLADMFGLDAFYGLLNEADPAALRRVLEALGTPDALLRYHRLLRELLGEGVSVSGWSDAILAAAKGEALESDDVGRTAELVREALAPTLPGNGPDVHRFRLGPGWEEALFSQGDDPSVDAAVALRFPEACGAYVEALPGPAAVVTSSHPRRRMIRVLLQGRLPDLPVLAAGELRAVMGERVAGASADDLPVLPGPGAPAQ